jgi:membrane-bound ClpP family serine protease
MEIQSTIYYVGIAFCVIFISISILLQIAKTRSRNHKIEKAKLEYEKALQEQKLMRQKVMMYIANAYENLK